MKRIIKNADIRSRPVFGRGSNMKYSSEGKIIAEMIEGGGGNLNQMNTADFAGAVAAGAGNAGKVWKTDEFGNPAWREDDEADVDSITYDEINAMFAYEV